MINQIISSLVVMILVWPFSHTVDDKSWDLLIHLKKERQITLTNDLTVHLQPSTDYSKMVLSAKSLFPDNLIPTKFFVIVKLKFLNNLKSPGTILCISDPDNEKRLSLTLTVIPGTVDKVTLNIIFHPINGERVIRDVILPFTRLTIWTFALSITEDRILVHTACGDTQRPHVYQVITLKHQTGRILFKNGAIVNLFHDGRKMKQLEGEVYELLLTNYEYKLQFICHKPMIDGSGSKTRRSDNERIGNVLLNQEEVKDDIIGEADESMIDEITGKLTRKNEDTSTSMSLNSTTVTKSESNLEINKVTTLGTTKETAIDKSTKMISKTTAEMMPGMTKEVMTETTKGTTTETMPITTTETTAERVTGMTTGTTTETATKTTTGTTTEMTTEKTTGMATGMMTEAKTEKMTGTTKETMTGTKTGMATETTTGKTTGTSSETTTGIMVENTKEMTIATLTETTTGTTTGMTTGTMTEKMTGTTTASTTETTTGTKTGSTTGTTTGTTIGTTIGTTTGMTTGTTTGTTTEKMTGTTASTTTASTTETTTGTKTGTTTEKTTTMSTGTTTRMIVGTMTATTIETTTETTTGTKTGKTAGTTTAMNVETTSLTTTETTTGTTPGTTAEMTAGTTIGTTTGTTLETTIETATATTAGTTTGTTTPTTIETTTGTKPGTKTGTTAGTTTETTTSTTTGTTTVTTRGTSSGNVIVPKSENIQLKNMISNDTRKISVESNYTTSDPQVKGQKTETVYDVNRTMEYYLQDKDMNKCKEYMDRLMSRDNCNEMTRLRLSKPKPGDKGEKGHKGERGEKGEIGLQGLTGTCDVSLCLSEGFRMAVKGEKGESGLCGTNMCDGMKGEKGDVGPTGFMGSKGEMGASNDINFELIKHLVSTMLPSEMDGILKNVKGTKGEPGECKTDIINTKKGNGGQRLGFQDKINIGYGSLVFENKEALEKVSFDLPLGSMVFLLKSDIFLVKVDYLNNIWRSISLETRSKDWVLPIHQTTPRMESRRSIFHDGVNKKLFLIALSVPTMGDLKLTTYQPGGYSGATFQCQQNGDIYGYGRLMHPFINTDMFNLKFMIHDSYKNIPIYNSRGEILANDFHSLLSKKEELQNDILNFDRQSINDNVMASCVWIGKDPLPEYRDYLQNAELKCNNWMTRHPLTRAMAAMLNPFKPLLSDDNMRPRSCSLQCHILCIQTEPHIQ